MNISTFLKKSNITTKLCLICLLMLLYLIIRKNIIQPEKIEGYQNKSDNSRSDTDPIDRDIEEILPYKTEIHSLLLKLEESNNYALRLESELQKVNSKNSFLEEQLEQAEIDQNKPDLQYLKNEYQ